MLILLNKLLRNNQNSMNKEIDYKPEKYEQKMCGFNLIPYAHGC